MGPFLPQWLQLFANSFFIGLSTTVLGGDASHRPDFLTEPLSYPHPQIRGGPGSAHSSVHAHPGKTCPSSQTGPSQFWRLPCSQRACNGTRWDKNPGPGTYRSFHLAFFLEVTYFSSPIQTHGHLGKTLVSPLTCGNLEAQTIRSQD